MTTLKGKKNVYACDKCRQQIVTVDTDDGTTPFMLMCRATKNCSGHMQSSFYRVDQSLSPTHEWYRKTDLEAQHDHPSSLQHHKMGGLFIREIRATPRRDGREG